MKYKNLVVFAVVAALVLIAGLVTETDRLSGQSAQKAPIENPLHIKKIAGKWRVVLPDSIRKPLKAHRGEKVAWTAFATDVYFHFPDSTLFGTYEAAVKAGGKLTLTVQPGAAPGRYPYSVFCVVDKEFARGDSPPVIIIE